MDSKFRGVGLGKLVMNSLLGKLKQCERVDLYCRENVMGFYEKLGFRKVRGDPGSKALMRLTIPKTAELVAS